MPDSHERIQRTIEREFSLSAPDDEPDIYADPPDVPDGWEPPEVLNTLRGKTPAAMLDEYPRSGLTGIYDTGRNIVYAGPRRVRHHNEQLGLLKQMGRLPERFIPFAWSTYPRGDSTRAEFDMPRSAGGAYQWVSRHREKDIEYVSTGEETTAGDIYAAVYALRLLGVPRTTEARVSYLTREQRETFEDLPDQMVRELKVNRKTFVLGDLYRQLAVDGHDPGPIVRRKLDADEGVVVLD